MDGRSSPCQGSTETKVELRLSPEFRHPSHQVGQPGAHSSGQQQPQTQDWVCEPPGRGRPSRHWSLSIDDRRRLAVLGGLSMGSPNPRDITQVVSQLVSEGVDKDVLIPHPPRPAQSRNIFHALLAQRVPLGQDSSLER
ncbi:testis-expressed protein 22 [Tamandua tetradactyla]|uniref:testis-expressed protein 22 n=1 Tax=Tamandua tetradactyla TaxID=48850 RepID=UPI00405479E0